MPAPLIQCLLLLSLAIFNSMSFAASAHEQNQLNLVQQQLDIIKHLATRAEATQSSEPNERYRFDYSRLTRDIQRIRQGVQDYLSPSRAQPRDPTELVGDYRLDTPPPGPSP